MKFFIEMIMNFFLSRYRMSIGCSEKLQLGSLIGTFNEVRHIKE